MNIFRNRQGLTLIELIVVITILGIVMIPVAIMAIEYVRSIVYSRDLAIAEGLAMTEMAKINNLAYSDATLDDGDDDTTANYEGYSFDLNRKVDYVAGSSNNLKKVEVTVYPSGTTATLVQLVTYIADVSFGAGSGGGAVGSGGEADSLVVAGGSISAKLLQNITLENTSGSAITITGVTATFSGAGGIKLNKIDMDGSERWSGNANSGSSVTLDTNFQLSASTTYNDTCHFTFSKNLTSATISFTMSDATTTGDYTW